MKQPTRFDTLQSDLECSEVKIEELEEEIKVLRTARAKEDIGVDAVRKLLEIKQRLEARINELTIINNCFNKEIEYLRTPWYKRLF